MTFPEICQWLYDSPFGTQVRESLFPWVEGAHVLAISLVVGSILFVDLRLLGLALRDRPVRRLVSEVLPITWSAFAIAMLTGATLFTANAPGYYANTAFRVKILLLLAVAINMGGFHAVTYRSVASWDRSSRTPSAARLAGAISLSLWIAIVAFGRWIGFTIAF